MCCPCSTQTKKVCTGLWSVVALFCLTAVVLMLLVYAGTLTYPAPGCLSGCMTLPPMRLSNGLVTLTWNDTLPSTGGWKYYEVLVSSTDKLSLSLTGEVINGNICLGYGALKPSECNLPDYVRDSPVFCIQPTKIVIGVFATANTSLPEIEFSFRLDLTVPYNDSGLVCLGEGVFWWIIIAVILAIGLVALVWIVSCWFICPKRIHAAQTDDVNEPLCYAKGACTNHGYKSV